MNVILGIEINWEFKFIVSFVSLNRISMLSIENINYNNIIFIFDKFLINMFKIRNIEIKKYICIYLIYRKEILI